MPATLYGLWSERKMAWWQDATGLVFYTTSVTLANLQRDATNAADNHMHRQYNWQVKAITGEKPEE